MDTLNLDISLFLPQVRHSLQVVGNNQFGKYYLLPTKKNDKDQWKQLKGAAILFQDFTGHRWTE